MTLYIVQMNKEQSLVYQLRPFVERKWRMFLCSIHDPCPLHFPVRKVCREVIQHEHNHVYLHKTKYV